MKIIYIYRASDIDSRQINRLMAVCPAHISPITMIQAVIKVPEFCANKYLLYRRVHKRARATGSIAIRFACWRTPINARMYRHTRKTRQNNSTNCPFQWEGRGKRVEADHSQWLRRCSGSFTLNENICQVPTSIAIGFKYGTNPIRANRKTTANIGRPAEIFIDRVLI